MLRPYWSGQIQISLVSFGVKLFSATEAKSEIHFHQLSRKSGKRIKHQKVSGNEEPVESADIVKGYEYRKGEYVMVEPEEIEHLRIPEAFAVVRKALQTTKKVALGKIAFGGREHLVAVAAPGADKLLGMMAYTMRYAEELRDPAEYFGEIKKVSVDEDQLSLAKELIKRKAAKFAPEKFKDEYEAALREMVEAKIKHAPIPRDEPAPKSAKVINLMDALRKSVRGDEAPAAKKRVAAKSATAKKGITLVKPSGAKANKTRKSA
jgi:DNA end-binding protein Ku